MRQKKALFLSPVGFIVHNNKNKNGAPVQKSAGERKMGRSLTNEKPLTATERKRLQRQKKQLTVAVCHESVTKNTNKINNNNDLCEKNGTPLGIYGKSDALQERRGLQGAGGGGVNTQTGEIEQEKKYDPVEARLERFIIQSASKYILRGSTVKQINNCLAVRYKGAEVGVHKSKEYGTASYSGLQTCGSVWVCPVCAAKISERRRVELVSAIDQHKKNGGEVLLLTLTNPHHLGDKLADVLEGQKKALSFFNCCKAAVNLNAEIGYIGQVRALEVTHGRRRQINNGWHPHYHILLFVQSGLDLIPLRRKYYERWAKACEKAWLKVPDYEHGLRLDDGGQAAKYASKWGLESELTKGHTKKSTDGETPWDFLRAVASDKDRQAMALFREFAETFKGKRQLFWSHGLKKQFSIGEATDEELADQQDDLAALLGIIELDDWRNILKADLRGEVLELARHGWEPVDRLIKSLRNAGKKTD